MTNKTLLLTLLLFCNISLFAQDEPVNSGKIIREGIEKYDNENYEAALSLFRKVPEYDTNGTWAMYEAAMTLSALKKNDESYEQLKRLVEEFKYLTPATFNLWGSAADDNGNSEEGLRIYRKGLELYPMSNLIAFNAGVTFLKKNNKENPDSAYHYGMRSTNINPLHPGSFNLLGMANVKKGRVVPALLNFIHGTLLTLGSKTFSNSYANFNAICSGGFDNDIKKATQPYSDFEGADFKDADYLIISRSALSENYKKKFKLRQAGALQTLFLIDMLEEEHEKIPFYGPLHIRFLRQVKAAGLTEMLAYALYIPSGNEVILAYQKKNSKKYMQLMQMFVKNINDFRAKKDLKQYGIDGGEYEMSYYKDGAAQIAAAIDETPNKGKATYLFMKDGSLMMSGYSVNGKWKGEALYYNREGNLEERRQYENGELLGETKYYYPDGTNQGNVIYPKNMETDTVFINFYHPDGVTPSFFSKKINGKYEGLNRVYFPDGTLKIAANYKNGKLSGTRLEYYENGELRSSEMFKDGNKEGTCVYYYAGGQKSSEGLCKANNYVGEWKTYFRNGKLSSVATYNDKGIDIGQGTDYYDDGKIAQEHSFDMDGKQNGSIKLYGLDGKVHSEFTFANKKVKSCKTYDADGNVVNNTNTVGKKLEFYKYDRHHRLFEKGVLENDERTGKFVEYRYGKDTSGIAFYKNGLLDGEVKKYYVNGSLHEAINYKDNRQHGKYTEYNLDGSVSYSGYYVNGNAEGIWKYYNDNGKLSETRFFSGDDKHGRFEFFDSKGNLYETEFYENDKKIKEIKYKNGVPVDTIDLSKGKTDVESKYGNGTVMERYTILNGSIHGKYTRYYPSGKEQLSTMFLNGLRHGETKRYYPNGQLLSVIPYQLGRIHGKAIYYGENGKIEKEIDYQAGDIHGTHISYYATGKKYKETLYKDDQIEGTRTYYAPDGKIIIQLFYERSYLTGYSHTDKSGNLLPMIPLENGSGKVTAYYASGAKSCEFNFKKSYFEGKQIAYYPGSENPIMIENWADAQQDGDQIYYDFGPNKKSYHSVMSKGNYEGMFREYHANGKVALEIDYNNDEIGSEKRYTESGALESHLLYENGILVGFAK